MSVSEVLWLIPARSGSKGIPDKNIRPLNGLPLLAYRIKTAQTFATSEDIFVSTDSEQYRAIAEQYGIKVPFLRPAELALDTSKTEDAVIHVMAWAESMGRKYKAIGLLQPTSPFVKPINILRAADTLMNDGEAESIVAVREVKTSTFLVQEMDKYLNVISDRIKNRANYRRQDLKNEVTPSGGFFIAKWDVFKQEKSFYPAKTLPYLVSDIEGLDIDEPLDWAWAEFLIEKKILETNVLFELDTTEEGRY